MDNISKENLQELNPQVGQVVERDPDSGQVMESNDEASEALPGIFGNPLILNRILEQLPNSKLLELSIVSKFWKKEAGIVMKKRGNVMALLKCDSDDVKGCGQVFQDFAANLETLNEEMYSGITIQLRQIKRCGGIRALEVERIHESILAGMRGKLKRLSIRLDRPEVCWKNARDCPNFRLLQLLLRDVIGDLEHLTLDLWKIMGPYIQQYLPHGPYPNLKVLKLYNRYKRFDVEAFGNHVKLLLPRAPNLQEIHTWGSISLRENLMKGREGVVLVHESENCIDTQKISENLIPALRLKTMRLSYNAELELGRFNEKAQNLLRTCCATTLEQLQLNAVSVVLLMSYGIRLINVWQLHIHLEYDELEQFEPWILSILSRFDFTYVFPNLKKVDIYCMGPLDRVEMSRDTIDAITEQANAVLKEPTVPRVGKLKSLDLYQHFISIAALEFFAQMFPDIQELNVRARGQLYPVSSAWDLWPGLKRIKVRGNWYPRPYAFSEFMFH